MTTKQAAFYLGVAAKTLERKRCTGDGPVFIKVGGGLRAKVIYLRSDLDAWIAENRHRSTAEYNTR